MINSTLVSFPSSFQMFVAKEQFNTALEANRRAQNAEENPGRYHESDNAQFLPMNSKDAIVSSSSQLGGALPKAASQNEPK